MFSIFFFSFLLLSLRAGLGFFFTTATSSSLMIVHASSYADGLSMMMMSRPIELRAVSDVCKTRWSVTQQQRIEMREDEIKTINAGAFK
jgi:hypothetical protein